MMDPRERCSCEKRPKTTEARISFLVLLFPESLFDSRAESFFDVVLLSNEEQFT
jgi:hypothetical protein